jgi:tRNA/tmRNA/rRNA uracil-C5-methylase (TrmA/RlmC/RlmD family)
VPASDAPLTASPLPATNVPEPPVLPVVVDLVIMALEPDGRGVGQALGMTVHVPFVLPGEIARVRVWRRGPSGDAEADLLEILTAAPERRVPHCPLFGTCGGCQVQHLPYPRQLEWKHALVRALMAPLGVGERVAACVASPREFGYRSKITPHHDRPRPGEPLPIGFLKVGRRSQLVDVEHCPLATDAINARLPAFRAEIIEAARGRRKGATFLLRDTASGVTTDPDARVVERVGALELEFFAREFFQNNPFLLPRLVDTVVGAATDSGARVLVDTYSGSGLFALSAAGRFASVVGVEVSPGAVAAARANAERNHIDNVRFVVADAARIFADLDVPGADAAVVVDPPRKGCGPAFLDQLIAFAPRTIVYVSCNPVSLAADLGRLLPAGYAVARIQPFDMFPQTRHVETVAVLSRIPANHTGGSTP